MLCLTRKRNEGIVLTIKKDDIKGDELCIKIETLETKSRVVCLGIDAPKSVTILRRELTREKVSAAK